MADLDKAVQTQLANIQKKTGKTLAELAALIEASGLAKHGEIRDMLKRDLGLGHGDANALALTVKKAAEPAAADPLDTIYAGPKAALRPIHEKLMEAITAFGPFEIAPKKANVSLRRKKQFALLGPATNTRFEVGLNMPALHGAAPRLEPLPPGGMCPYRVRLASAAEVDQELLNWIRLAYDSAA